MVRAAAAGVIDYTKADPNNQLWRIKHQLLLNELERTADYDLLSAAQRHWLALLAHGSLTEESFASAKKNAADILDTMKKLVFPWLEDPVKEDAQQDTISNDPATQELINRYHELFGKPEEK